jgi:hypothetical protein
MAIYINSPEWFEGIDSVIGILSIAVALLVTAYGYKIHRITKEKSHLYFSTAFLLVVISYAFRLVSELAIYSTYVKQSIIGPFIVSRTILEPVTWVHTYSHMIFRLLYTFAFLILLIVAWKIRDKPVLILLTYFMIVITIVSTYAQFVFHLTMLMILALLTFHFYHNYLKNNAKQALMVTLAFLGIMFSHILFMFMHYDPNIYAIGEGFQLLGYVLLLYAMILVKKK